MFDTEWHFLFGCPSTAASLSRLAAFGATSPTSPAEASAHQLVSSLEALRCDAAKLGDFATGLWFALQRRQRQLEALSLTSLHAALSRRSVGSVFLASRAVIRSADAAADLVISEALAAV